MTTGEATRPSPPWRPWREQALRRLLSVISVLLPLLLVSTLLLRTPVGFTWRAGIMVGCVSVVVLLRFWRTVPFRGAAALSIGALYVPAMIGVSQFGLVPIPPVAATAAIVLAAIYFSRAQALALWGLTLVGYLTLGWLVAHGQLTLHRLTDSDPLIFKNWIRVALNLAIVAGFLAAAVRFLVDSLETHYESALRADRDLRLAYEQLGQLNRRVESTRDDERRLLAHELHDEFGQTLTALKLRFQMLGQSTLAPDSGQQLKEAVGLIDGLIGRVREISLNLRPALLDEVGLAPALRAYVEAQDRLARVPITLTIKGLERRLSPEVEMACFRVVQEAITNILRHAAAKTASVCIEQGETDVVIAIHDDGRGFIPAETGAGPGVGDHLGLIGMRERARALRGEFSVLSRPGEGTRIHLRLPVSSTPPVAPPT